MREFLNLSLKLMIICAVAGAALGLTNNVTKDKIAEQIVLEANQARKELFPQGNEFKEIKDAKFPEGVKNAYEVLDSSGKSIGMTVSVEVEGYKAAIPINVGIDNDDKIVGIRIGTIDETPGLGAKIKEEQFYGQFAGTDLNTVGVKQDGGSIDAVSAATISSRAVCKGVKIATDAAKELKANLVGGGDDNG